MICRKWVKREAHDFKMGCGGKGANQAIAAAKLGASVMMMTKAGDDVFDTINNFAKYGVISLILSKKWRVYRVV